MAVLQSGDLGTQFWLLFRWDNGQTRAANMYEPFPLRRLEEAVCMAYVFSLISDRISLFCFWLHFPI
jgi:hypothetical protein